MSYNSFSLLQLLLTVQLVSTMLYVCSMMHDDQNMELQQHFAEAKCVIQQLAGQVDHYSNTQQQLAGLLTVLLCSASFVLQSPYSHLNPPVQPSYPSASHSTSCRHSQSTSTCRGSIVIPLFLQTFHTGASHSLCCRTHTQCMLFVQATCLCVSARHGAGVRFSMWCTVV